MQNRSRTADDDVLNAGCIKRVEQRERISRFRLRHAATPQAAPSWRSPGDDPAGIV